MGERKLISSKWYLVIKDYTRDVLAGAKIKAMAYSVSRGDSIKFRGKNLGRAEFLNKQGQLIILPYKVAFDILKVPEED